MALGSRFSLPPIRTAASKLAIAVIVCSLVGYIVQAQSGVHLQLVPNDVLQQFTLWQLLTFIPLEYSPMGLLFTALIIWQMGAMLEMAWGARRFYVLTLAITFISGVLTVAAAALIPSLRGFPYMGGFALSSVIWVMYGLWIGRGMTNFWGLAVTGNVFALIGVGFVVVSAVFGGWQGVVPEVFALGLAFLYVKVGSPRFIWLKFQSWRLQRDLKGRSKRFKVLDGERNMPTDSDRYLH